MDRIGTRLLALIVATHSFTAGFTSAADIPDAARREAAAALAAAAFQGGLIVHIDDGGPAATELAAALAAGPGRLVQSLSTNARRVPAARERLRQLELAGTVVVNQLDGETLPFVDNLVNLVVAADADAVSKAEMIRVLAPHGVVCVKRDGQWTATANPWPADIDQWTHYLHDASGNAVAQDSRIGPPKHLQWVGGPNYLRHHDHMSGLSAMVSAEGRLFYIVDLGPRWSVQMPPQWTLVARDAFSGVVLWQRPVEKWHPHLWPLKRGPAQILRRLVAVGDRVFVTLGLGAPVSTLDAATGATLREIEGTEGAEEIIVHDGILYSLVNPELDAYRDIPTESVDAIRSAGREWNWDEGLRRIVASNAPSGKHVWSRESPVAPSTLAAADNRLCFHNGDHVVCLDAHSGEPIWNSEPIARWKPMHVLFGPALVLYKDVVLCAGGEKMDPLGGGKDTMTALSATTGEKLWTAPHPESGYASGEDLLVINDLVWFGATTNVRSSGILKGRDLLTGEIRSEFPPDDWQPHMSHHRCYKAKATCNYILMSRTGIEFVDIDARHWIPHHWVRGSCNYGVLPCNGLIYAPPHSCACYLLAKLNGLNALAPASPTRALPAALKDEDRLETGPAYQDVTKARVPNPASPSDWPTFRGDPSRSGSASTAVPRDLRLTWRAPVGGRLSSLTVAGGKVFVASIDEHSLHALDAASGQPAWTFSAGGRIDSPPTLWRDLVLFGAADGRVYCVTADDGTLVWRFRAAPIDRRHVAYEQIESVWPVSGGVLIREIPGSPDAAELWCVAGRNMWLDGGMRLLRLHVRTGQKLSETVLDDRFPGAEDNLQKDIRWPNLPVALPDVLSSDGRFVYMRSQPFGPDGLRTEVITPRNHELQRGETAHLFSPTGFLDDSWWHRTYWIYGRSYVSGAAGWNLASEQAPAGRILCFDADSVYGFGRVPLRFRGTPNSYHLFACPKEPKLIAAGRAPARKNTPYTLGDLTPKRVQYRWSHAIPFLARAMALADDSLFLGGPPVPSDETEPYQHYGDAGMQKKLAEQVAAFQGGSGSLLMAVAKSDASRRAAFRLDSAPVFDGLAVAQEHLFLAMLDGSVLCLGADGAPLEPAPDVGLEPVPVRRD